MHTMKQRLPFPTRPFFIQGDEIEEYIIPDDKRAEVLRDLYPFTPVPKLNSWQEDIHSGKKFRTRDYVVVIERGLNWLVSPYYAEAGGTVIDWIRTSAPRVKRP